MYTRDEVVGRREGRIGYVQMRPSQATSVVRIRRSLKVRPVKGGRLAFPTHEEAAYPILLCTRPADIALQKALEMGAVQLVDLPRQLATTSTTSQRFLLDMLPKGKKFRPLVSEYGQYVLVGTAALKINHHYNCKSFPKEQR